MKNLAFTRRLRFAVQGLLAAWRNESSFRVHCAATAFVVLVLLLKRPAPVWWAVLLLTCAAVMAAELINTALEHALDLISPGQNPAVGLAKDCAAGAVLVLSLCAVAVFIAFLVAT